MDRDHRRPGNPGKDGFDRLHEWGTAEDGEVSRPAGPAADGSGGLLL
ncbi:MAG: hypothetical protein ACRDWY_08370 [Actinomycetes bacterium]